MVAFAFTPGHLALSGFQAAGGVLASLNIKSHDLKLSVLLEDVTGTAALGARARIAGPLDADGNMACSFDLLAPPYGNPPLIIPGVQGIAVFGLSPIKAIQVPIIVESLHFVVAVDKDVVWDFASKMSSLAGLVVYPPL